MQPNRHKCFKLARVFNDPELASIGYANMQWIAGLNCGLTQKGLEESVVYQTDLDEGLALPVSMICGVGHFTAGSWFQTRGVICNGFSQGKQFQIDTDPSPSEDRPDSFTDEDWIAHSAGWITGLIAYEDYKDNLKSNKP